MKLDNKFPILVIVGIAASFVLGATALIVIITAERSSSELPVLGKVPQFQFIKQDGSPFGSYDMLGKINIIDFIFTSCRDLCPAMSGNMARLYHQFDSSGKIQFVSITVDPEHDSLSVLRQYSQSFGVNDNRWVFLWQSQDEVARLSEKGFMLSAIDLPEGHSSKFILVDDKGQIRGYYEGNEMAGISQLSRDIAELARAMK